MNTIVTKVRLRRYYYGITLSECADDFKTEDTAICDAITKADLVREFREGRISVPEIGDNEEISLVYNAGDKEVIITISNTSSDVSEEWVVGDVINSEAFYESIHEDSDLVFDKAMDALKGSMSDTIARMTTK